MVFTMLRMKRRVVLTVGEFAPLTLTTFVAVIILHKRTMHYDRFCCYTDTKGLIFIFCCLEKHKQRLKDVSSNFKTKMVSHRQHRFY